MVIQAIVIFIITYNISYAVIFLADVLLGIGTALVYPVILAAIGDYTHPEQRAERIGAYRFWPYLGYAIGALSSVIIADVYGLQSG